MFRDQDYRFVGQLAVLYVGAMGLLAYFFGVQ